MPGDKTATGARSGRPARRGARGGWRARRARQRGSGPDQPSAPGTGDHDGPRRVECQRPVTDYRQGDHPAPPVMPAAGGVEPSLPPELTDSAGDTVSGMTDGQNQNVGLGVKIGLINIQSIKPKLLELSGQLHQGHYDIMGITESWLTPSTPNRLLTLPGFQLYRADRPDKRGFGGVALAVKDGINITLLKVNTGDNPNSKLETLWTVVKPDKKRQFVMCTVYRPPRRAVADIKADFDELECQYQQVLLDYARSKVIICGDFNCDLNKPDSDPAKKILNDFMSDYSLHQFVNDSTYSSGSILDLFMSNCAHLVTRCNVIFCDFSPHKFVHVCIDLPRYRPTPRIVRTRCIRRVDPFALHCDLLAADWSHVFNSVTVTSMWDNFVAMFLFIFDAHAPVRAIRLRNPNAPPVSNETKSLMARRRAELASHGHDSENYRDLNRAVRSAIRRDTRNDIQRRIGEGKNRSVWHHISSVVGNNQASRKLPDATPDQLNEFFVSVGPRVTSEVSEMGDPPDLPCRLPRVGACSLVLAPISLSELRTVVFSMKGSAACGEDGINIRMIWLSFDAIGPLILRLVNSSILHSDIPASWKHSLVHPVFKSGDPTNASNYRPISIVPVIAKIVERAVHQQLYHYMSSNHLLSPTQHGFRPRYSTETALISVSDQILAANDRGELSLLCLLDLSKCFDVIDHSKLLSKLRAYGIDTSWFSAYLKHHTQSVSIMDSTGDNKKSHSLPNNVGVFQGSSLGPLLYSIFSNDLSLFAEDATVVQYADDTQILISGKKSELQNTIKRMELILSSLDTWFRANGLKVNTGKTQMMLLGSPQNVRQVPSFFVKFRDTELLPVREVKNIGVMFDRTLSWDAHISLITRRCFGILAGISHLRGHLPSSVIFTLVDALVLSQVRYCLTVYGNGTQKNFDRIQKIINYGARVIYGRRKFDHVSDLLIRLGWLNAKQLSTYQTLCLTHKVRCRREPESLAAGFSTVAEVHERPTRRDNELYIPRSRTEMGKRRFVCRAPGQYNAVPPELVRLPTSLFGPHLKQHLLAATPRAD